MNLTGCALALVRKKIVPGCRPTGSAFGSGGLRARLGRHLRRSKAQRWHIDYLRGKTALAGAYWLVDDARLEDLWVGRLATCEHLKEAVTGFGASDSRRSSHLFYGPELISLPTLRALLSPELAGDVSPRFQKPQDQTYHASGAD